MAADVRRLGLLALALGRVDRITYHPDGVTPESDADHTVMLAVVACDFADRWLPELDRGKIAQYALVHDLVEVYAGDTPTLRITDGGLAAKAEREAAAFRRLSDELGSASWAVSWIRAYEHRWDAEARYVKALDKLLPKVTHIANGCLTIREQGMDVGELTDRYGRQLAELEGYAAEFGPLFQLRSELVDHVLAIMDSHGADV